MNNTPRPNTETTVAAATDNDLTEHRHATHHTDEHDIDIDVRVGSDGRDVDIDVRVDDDGHGVDIDIHIDDDEGHGHDGHEGHGQPVKTILIEVNSQNVTMRQHKATGAEIKNAAIAQGVAIQTTFVLSVKHGNRYDIVGDDDVVTLHPGLDFIATDTDDNS